MEKIANHDPYDWTKPEVESQLLNDLLSCHVCDGDGEVFECDPHIGEMCVRCGLCKGSGKITQATHDRIMRVAEILKARKNKAT
jgi:hypothetical protein